MLRDNTSVAKVLQLLQYERKIFVVTSQHMSKMEISEITHSDGDVARNIVI